MNKSVIAVATILHLLPRPFGVSTVGATALYAGAFGSRRFWATPLIPLTAGSLVFGIYQPVVMLFVFLGFVLSTFSGRWFLTGNRSRLRFSGAIVTGAAIFYVASNFGIWLAGFYPLTAAGFVQCYVNGLPYLGQAVLADSAFCFVLFGMHALSERRRPVSAPA